MEKKHKPSDDAAEMYRIYIRTSAVGIQLVLSVVIGVFLGWLAEQYFAISPWGLILGSIFGIIAAGRMLYTFAKNYLKKNG